MKEIKASINESKKKLKGLKKSTRTIIISIITLCIGLFGLPGSIIADLLYPIIQNDFAVLIAIMVKAALMVGGTVGTIMGLADELRDLKDIENNLEEDENLISLINEELAKEKEKNKSLTEQLNKSKEMVIKKDQKAFLNEENKENIEYNGKVLHKVKR